MVFLLVKRIQRFQNYIAKPLIRFGIPLSVMGLLLKEGIDINLIKSAFLAFFVIGFLITLINLIPIFNKMLPNYPLQLAGLIGNTSFLGIPNLIRGLAIYFEILGFFFPSRKPNIKKGIILMKRE